jgi:hypothetical protein
LWGRVVEAVAQLAAEEIKGGDRLLPADGDRAWRRQLAKPYLKPYQEGHSLGYFIFMV